jgi:hypothetical protein
MTAKIEGDFVVFLIGARLNNPWKLGQFKWLGDSMNGMIQELEGKPETGFLGYQSWISLTPVMVQYWRSSEQLMAYARARDTTHYPAWVKFNKELAKKPDIGIWQETYLVKAGDYECVYNNMPLMGLAKVAQSLEAQGQHMTAQGRLGQTDGTDAPISVDGTERA